jgi:hypothetical protein
MKGRVSLVVGGAVGYVLGSRAGRQRYEQIKAQSQKFWQSPTVQQKKQEAQDFAREKAPEVKSAAVDAAAGAAAAAQQAGSAAKDKVSGSSDGSDGSDGPNGSSPA